MLWSVLIEIEQFAEHIRCYSVYQPLQFFYRLQLFKSASKQWSFCVNILQTLFFFEVGKKVRDIYNFKILSYFFSQY